MRAQMQVASSRRKGQPMSPRPGRGSRLAASAAHFGPVAVALLFRSAESGMSESGWWLVLPGLGLLGWALPLTLLRLSRGSPFVATHARESLNLQLTLLGLLLVGGALIAWRSESASEFDVLGPPWVANVGLYWGILATGGALGCLIGGLVALAGEPFRYVVAVPFLRAPRRNRIRTKETGGGLRGDGVQ